MTKARTSCLAVALMMVVVAAVLAFFAWGWLTTPRQSAVRTSAWGDLKQIQMAIDMYQGDTGALPGSMQDLYSATYLQPSPTFDGYASTTVNGQSIVYSKTTFRAVKKGEPWGGPGDVAERDVPEARAVLIIGDAPTMMPETEFQALMARD